MTSGRLDVIPGRQRQDKGNTLNHSFSKQRETHVV